MREKLHKLCITIKYYLTKWCKSFLCLFDRYFRKPLTILDEKQTIDYILEHNCSVARFGDGELNLMAYGQDIGFQKSSDLLRDELKRVLQENAPGILICLSNRLNIRKGTDFKKLSKWWKLFMKHNLHDWLKLIPPETVYGDTNISRLTGEKLFGTREKQAFYTAKIWENENVILIEGEGTRFGVGNALLGKAKSVNRILGPATDAFDKKTAILEAAVTLGERVENPLFVLALGPTATILAYDLWKRGYRAIDIGHLDLMYEKAVHNNSEEIQRTRYDNETKGGNSYEPCTDKDYLAQIIVQIK